ncbi:serine protease AprX [Caldalkalibacillus uzonensis]|uniref:Serine protease AprX n=1 Tax=Caldalkalibacillus uzonensis TaxID=353224 RepID=A0ABU0CSC8_9BACI|nr:S8 family peptidase [Caldalkalibacillus uzonensis]MDQ0339321.1 serine protease AprX [Caldalkalibacillus uzonensis]
MSMLSIIRFILGFGYKLDRSLRKVLLKPYRTLRWIPCLLYPLLEKILKKTVSLPVIIQFDEQSFQTMDTVMGITRQYWRCRIKHRYPAVGCCSADLNVEAIEKLVTDCPQVKKIFFDREVRALLDVASPAILAHRVHRQGLTGKGVTIAVIDTGIYPHPDLINPENRLVAFKDFVNQRTEPYDDHGHGTHCAGDAVSNGYSSNGTYTGPAPEAQVVGVKVLNGMGSGNLSTVMAGVQWCIDHKEQYGIDIISMSLGSTATQPAKDDPLVQIVEKAWRAGIVVCAAAGNEGPEEGTIASPGISPLIITVGAMDDKGTVTREDDEVAPFSSRGPTVDQKGKPDLLAPGVNIISWRAPGSFLDKASKSGWVGEYYMTMSGTSMATPICAGVAALILEQHPGLSPDEVKRRMLETAQDWDLPPQVQGKGYVDAEQAISI